MVDTDGHPDVGVARPGNVRQLPLSRSSAEARWVSRPAAAGIPPASVRPPCRQAFGLAAPVLAAQLLVKVVLDEVETLVQSVERAGKLLLSGGHLLEGSAEREALAIMRVSALPNGGIHRASIFERAAPGFIRTKP